MTSRMLLLLLSAAAHGTACGGEVPSAPSIAPVQIQARWLGTLATSDGLTFSIAATIIQSRASVQGSWSEQQWLDYSGRIRGTVDDSTFTGTVTLDGSPCEAAFSGPSTVSSLNWSSPGFPAGCSIAPAGITLSLQWVGPYQAPPTPTPPTTSPQPFP